MHEPTCYSEGDSGRCGFNCRVFNSGHCENFNEVIYSDKISYDEFLDLKLIYNLKGDEMKIIQQEINDLHDDYSLKIRVLLAINAINWENLAVDEVLCVGNYFDDFYKGSTDKRHFFGVTEDKFECFNSGKSSKTASASEKSIYDYALPEVEYNKLIGRL